MALSHATYRAAVFILGGFVGDQRTLRLPRAVRALYAVFFTALAGLSYLSFVVFVHGITLVGQRPALF